MREGGSEGREKARARARHEAEVARNVAAKAATAGVEQAEDDTVSLTVRARPPGFLWAALRGPGAALIDRTVHVPGVGEVQYDLAYGGNFYAIVPIERLGIPFERGEKQRMLDVSLAMMDAINQALDEPEAFAPKVDEPERSGPTPGAMVELLKVLLKQVSDDAGVATRLIANAADIESLAREKEPDIAALKGWRREVFGEMALRLKSGKVALAASPKGVSLKNENNKATMMSATKIAPTSWADISSEPYQASAEYPLTPASANVGTLGNKVDRLAEATASAVSLPDCTCGKTEPKVANELSTCPPMTSVTAGLAPLYGMCVI